MDAQLHSEPALSMCTSESQRMQILQDFELIDPISKGPRGTLYKGRDLRITRALPHDPNRLVAVKIMPAENLPENWLDLQQRLARTYHASLTPITSAGIADGQRAFLATPWANIPNLAQWLSAHTSDLDPRTILDISIQIAQAVASCHRNGVVHMGLKPSNILICDPPPDPSEETPLPLVLDFGLLPDSTHAAWLAPELLHGGLGTIHADIYGVALLTLTMLARTNPLGIPLLEERTITQRLAQQHTHNDSLQNTLNAQPPFLREILTRALHPKPEQRHHSLNELIRELQNARYNSPGLGQRSDATIPTEWVNVQGSKAGVEIRDGYADEVTLQTHGTRQLLRFHFKHRDEVGNWTRSGVFFYNHGSDDEQLTFRTLQAAWEGAELSLYDAVGVPKGGQLYYTGNASTLPILEPYFPVAVTTIVNSEGCASRYLTDLRDFGSTNQHLILGSIVHHMLEILSTPALSDHHDLIQHSLADPDAPHALYASFDPLFDRAVDHFRLKILAAGLTTRTLAQLKNTARTHYSNILQLAARARHNPFKGALSEVTRYSGKYGLEGRLDLVLDDGDAFRILELKTGRARDRDIKQVRCYALLWDTIGHTMDRKVIGEVLYSNKGSTTPVPRDQHDRDRRILKARNEVVALHRHLAFGDTPFTPPHFMEHPNECRNEACKYRRKKCEFQSRLLGLGPFGHPKELPSSNWGFIDPDLIQLARAYYRRFVAHIENEYWTATQRLGQILRPEALPDRIKRLEAIHNLTLASIDAETARVTFQGKHTQLFSVGTSVLAHRGDFQADLILSGRVLVSTRGLLVVYSPSVLSLQNVPNIPRDGWILDNPPSRIGHRSSHRALFDFMRCRDPKRLSVLLQRSIPTTHTPKTSPAPPSSQLLDSLNDSQRAAVQGALQDSPAYLIQGPPGTGKTTVIAALIISLAAQGKRVLLVAGTNTAVDNVLKRLIQYKFTRFLRLGNQHSSPQLVDLLRTQTHHSPDLWFAQDLARRTQNLDSLRDHICNTLVIASTAHRANSSPVIELLERNQGHQRDKHPTLPTLFDVAIIDEASQITEPITLGAINRAKRFVLVGDHKQLPPVVVSDHATSGHADAQRTLRKLQPTPEPPPDPSDDIAFAAHIRTHNDALLDEISGIKGLDQSLFERLEGHIPSTRLTTQYRMNANIMAYSSRQFYEGTLRAAPAVENLRLPIHQETLQSLPSPLQTILDPKHPVVLVDVQGTDAGRRNQEEAQAVLTILKTLLKDNLLTQRDNPQRPFLPGDAASEIGIISPFRAQVQLLRHLLDEELNGYPIETDTVERFQGGEKEIILVSFVASGRVSKFLTDARRLNVTLTRAKSKLIIVANLSTLCDISTLFRTLIEQEESTVVPFPQHLSEPTET